MIARVQPLTRTRALRGPFDYRLREDQTVEVGSLLRVPFSGRRSLGVVVELAETSELPDERLSEPEAVLDAGAPAELVGLAGWMAREYCSTPARALGLVLAPGAGDVGPKRALVAELTLAGRAALGGAEPLTGPQRDALAVLAERGPAVAAELGTPRLRRLESRGLVSLELRDARRRPIEHAVGSASVRAPRLTDAQRAVAAPVIEALGRRESARFLLHGVTGSGKTEVYLRAVEETLAQGRTAVVLVPEIALTPQATWRFRQRFGDVVAVLHSGLGQGERFDEWRRLRAGEARVCVGPRSAVFAPLADVGLIVVDEEHEPSYKHEGDPRYDARGVAEHRAAQAGAVLLLGSATPRPESAAATTRLRLPERIDGRALPPVEVLDMRGSHHPLHAETQAALAALRRGGGKGIVLLNRRGWSNFLACRACGHVWACPNCEVSLVLHRELRRLACHHCGHREAAAERCPDCGSVSVARHGAGTERLEHDLRDALGEESFPVFRLDADASSVGERARVLQGFERADAGILVGTQMVAKGHDFPDVTLGVVVDADQTLRFPDFRAEERTFSLLTQLAGRTGRGRAQGRVLVQTLAPDARAIAFAARHDADGFLAEELERRRALRYPPFSSLIRVVCSCQREEVAKAAAESLRRRIAPPDADVLGPAPLFRLRGRSRSQIVVKARDRAAAIRSVGDAVDALSVRASRRGVSLSVDVDPQ